MPTEHTEGGHVAFAQADEVIEGSDHFRYWHKYEVPTGSENVCLSGVDRK